MSSRTTWPVSYSFNRSVVPVDLRSGARQIRPVFRTASSFCSFSYGFHDDLFVESDDFSVADENHRDGAALEILEAGDSRSGLVDDVIGIVDVIFREKGADLLQ